MDTQQARRKWDSLRRMTKERGCSEHEAATARRLADALAKKYGFADAQPSTPFRQDFDTRFNRAAERAATRFRWEYRKCGKSTCWCARCAPGHGPYKYHKERDGKTVRSVYLGRYVPCADES